MTRKIDDYISCLLSPLNALKAPNLIKRSVLLRESKGELNRRLVSIGITRPPFLVLIYKPLPLGSLCQEYPENVQLSCPHLDFPFVAHQCLWEAVPKISMPL